jgi:hypothetical protein
MVRHIKFGTPTAIGKTAGATSELRQQIVEFFKICARHRRRGDPNP